MTDSDRSAESALAIVDMHAVLFFALCVLEAIVFFWTIYFQIASHYPIGFDQLSYFAYAYDLIVRVWSDGGSVLVDEFRHPRQANGVSFTVQGALLGLMFGPSRTTLLSLNLLYIITTQIVLFQTLRTRTRNVECAWIGLALFIGCNAIFRSGTGNGIFDFSADFPAMCGYGILACLAVWRKTFINIWLSMLFAVFAAILISMRFFIAPIFAMVTFCLFVFFMIRRWSAASPIERAVAQKKARNIALAGGLAACLSAPLLYLAREGIYSYYVVGHFIGEEKIIRANQLELRSLLDHILYYPNSLMQHIGRLVLIATVVLAVTALISAYRFDDASPRRVLSLLRRYSAEYVVLGIKIVVPILILTFNFHKSPSVATVVVVPCVLLFALLLDAIGRHNAPAVQMDLEQRWPWSLSLKYPLPARSIWNSLSRNSAKTIISALVALVALAAFPVRGLGYRDATPKADRDAIIQLNTAIGLYVIENGLAKPTFSIDRVVGYLNWGTLRLGTFERFRRLIDFDPRFGHSIYGIFATPRETALQLVMDSDIVVLTDPIKGRSATLPIDQKIVEYWDELDGWTRANRDLLTSAQVYGIPNRVYVKARRH